MKSVYHTHSIGYEPLKETKNSHCKLNNVIRLLTKLINIQNSRRRRK